LNRVPGSVLQGAYAGFVYTYAVEEPMSLPHKTAGYLASIFWAAITVGRLVSIPLNYRFKPVKLLLVNLVMTPPIPALWAARCIGAVTTTTTESMDDPPLQPFPNPL
jgi:fucose permease